MKKTVLGILTSAVVLSACAATAFAAGSNGTRNSAEHRNKGVFKNPSTSCVYADTDRNGSYDIQDTRIKNDADKTKKSFTDEDGDGICDNYTSAQNTCKGNKNRSQGECKGVSQGGQGKNFVDTDNDGICDNYTSEKYRGNSSGCGAKNSSQNSCRGKCIK